LRQPDGCSMSGEIHCDAAKLSLQRVRCRSPVFRRAEEAMKKKYRRVSGVARFSEP
jgi:hypothetical protein